MQNIAENFLNTCPSRDYKGVEDKLDTFIVFSKRRRVISYTKRKRRHADKSLLLYTKIRMVRSLLDIFRNAHDLLSQSDIKLPEIGSNDKYLNSGPPFLTLLYPASVCLVKGFLLLNLVFLLSFRGCALAYLFMICFCFTRKLEVLCLY
ncbi:UTP--glucose-1-phosphate uridylyltransferase 3, chloroplastic-like [Rosa chinensis]|uniref:UTP--glucose-1-phosphate uridylyltransferase 3, chloroplastic-like n=1 Tax=Rosa chinensis TaxID=74649 RepID=UPI001AD8DA99|nr:UTP--glucose-1-phosphate uridylyltransferase 3, chloroplastic-like [Rosa chinensis]